jgi:hypothetical protein
MNKALAVELFHITGNSSGYCKSNELQRLSAIATLDSAPAFTFSQFPSYRTQDVLVSFPTFVRLSEGALSGVEDIKMKDFIIQLKDDVSDDDIDRIKKELDFIIGTSSGVSIWDYRDDFTTIDTATTILGYFFNFTTAGMLMLSCIPNRL